MAVVDARLDLVEALGRAAGLPPGSPSMNGRSRSSMSLVRSFALSASVRATRTVGTSSDVGGEARGDERADELARGNEHLAAHVAALLLAGELVLEVNAGGARLDHRLHQLEGVERAAEAGLGVRHDRREPVALALALGVLDLIGAHERLVDALDDVRDAVGRVEALVRVHVAGRVGVGGDLPAGEVARPSGPRGPAAPPVAGERAERVDVVLRVEHLPEALRAERRERVLDLERAAQPLDVRLRVGTDDAVEALRMEEGACLTRHALTMSVSEVSRESTTRAAVMMVSPVVAVAEEFGRHR